MFERSCRRSAAGLDDDRAAHHSSARVSRPSRRGACSFLSACGP